MSFIPTHYPVTLTDGEREYQVFNATEYVNGLFHHGHRSTAAPESAPQAPATAELAD
jgi:hypothetical protein